MNENKFKHDRRFDEPPYEMGRTACGINALIEVLQLPIEKLTHPASGSISNRLIELSSDKEFVTGIGAMSVKLQKIINERCKDPKTLDEVMKLCEQKCHHLSETNSLI